MAKVKIVANAQPETVRVEVGLTPRHFAHPIVKLVDKDGKDQGFCFGLCSSGSTVIAKDRVQFVGTKKDVKLVAECPLSVFGANVEDAKLELGEIVAKVNALEKQMVEAYKARKHAAEQVEVISPEAAAE